MAKLRTLWKVTARTFIRSWPYVQYIVIAAALIAGRFGHPTLAWVLLVIMIAVNLSYLVPLVRLLAKRRAAERARRERMREHKREGA